MGRPAGGHQRLEVPVAVPADVFENGHVPQFYGGLGWRGDGSCWRKWAHTRLDKSPWTGHDHGMSDESNALLALKNAWTGTVNASERVRELSPEVQHLAEDMHLKDLDLETYHRVTLAQSNAVMALRGLVEQLQRKRESDLAAG